MNIHSLSFSFRKQYFLCISLALHTKFFKLEVKPIETKNLQN